VLESFLLQKQPVLRKAAMPGTEPEEEGDDDAFGSGPIMPNRPRNHDRKIEEAARKRHERLVRQWEDISGACTWRARISGTSARCSG
jgi:hypothetical protein